jgi:hypothetical protein
MRARKGIEGFLSVSGRMAQKGDTGLVLPRILRDALKFLSLVFFFLAMCKRTALVPSSAPVEPFSDAKTESA